MRAALYTRVLLATLSLLTLATSARAESGWYLMAPPILDGRVADERPLRAWSQLGAFANVQECNESMLSQHGKALREEYVPWIGPNGRVPVGHVEAWIVAHNLAVARADRALCIASDDSRLGGRP